MNIFVFQTGLTNGDRYDRLIIDASCLGPAMPLRSFARWVIGFHGILDNGMHNFGFGSGPLQMTLKLNGKELNRNDERNCGNRTVHFLDSRLRSRWISLCLFWVTIGSIRLLEGCNGSIWKGLETVRRMVVLWSKVKAIRAIFTKWYVDDFAKWIQ